MKQDDLDRIAELEELLEMGEELEPEDREELKELRSELRAENSRSKSLAAWAKAKEVYRLSFPGVPDDDPIYALTPRVFDEMSAMYDWVKDDYVVEKIARPDFPVGFDEFQQIYGKL